VEVADLHLLLQSAFILFAAWRLPGLPLHRHRNGRGRCFLKLVGNLGQCAVFQCNHIFLDLYAPLFSQLLLL
jgi:hypothetical protein